MSFLDKAKQVGMSEQDARVFKAFVQKAKSNKFSNEEILQAWENRTAPVKETKIRAPDPILDSPPSGEIRPPMSAAEMTTDLIRRGRPTSLAKGIAEYAPETLGAAALVTAGAPATIPSAMALAALGGAGGRGYQLASRSLTGAPGAPQLKPGEIVSGEALRDVAGAGVRQGVAEGLGRIVLRTIGRVIRGGMFKPTEEAAGPLLERRESIKAARLAGNKVDLLKARGTPPRDLMEAYGGRYTAAQMTDSRVIDVMDNMAQGSFFGGGTMDRAYLAQQKSLKEMGDTVADAIMREGQEQLTDRQLGQLFVDTVNDGRTAFKASAEKMFRNVDDIVYEGMQKGAQQIFPKQAAGMAEKMARTPKPTEYGYVNTKPIAERASQILSEYKRISNIGKSEAGGTFLDKVASIPERLSFGDAQLLRSGLLEEVRNLAKEGGQGLRFARELAGLTDSQMERSAANLGGEALEAWRSANKFYKFGKTNFDSTFIQKLASNEKTNWSEVGDLIFRSGDDEAVREARRAIRAASFTTREAPKPVEFQKTWRQMQAGYYESLLKKNTDPLTGNLKAEGLLKDLSNRKTERTIKAAFSNDQLNAIRNFAKVAHLADPKNRAHSGVNMIQWAQGGAILALTNPFDIVPDDMEGLIRKVGGGILIGPYVISKMLTNPMATRWLIQGIRTPIASGAAGGLGARLGLAAVRAAQDTQTLEEDVPND